MSEEAVQSVETPDTQADATPTQEPTKAEARKLKLKVDGQEGEYDEAEVIKWAQQGKSAAKRYQEAAEMKKQAESFISRLKDPKQLAEILRDPAIGVDVKAWAEQYVWEQLQEEKLTPEQRRQRDIDNELKKYRDKEAKEKADAEAKEAKALQEKYEVDYEKKILSALERGGLPTKGKAGREVVRRMANYMLTAAQNSLDLEPADLVSQVRRDLNEEHRALYDDAPEELLEQLIGEKAWTRLNDSKLKKLKNPQSQNQANRAQAERQSQQTRQPTKRLSPDELREQMMRDLANRRK